MRPEQERRPVRNSAAANVPEKIRLRYMIEAKPDNLIGDRAYDSNPLVRSCATTALR
jgi:hypothetical protein